MKLETTSRFDREYARLPQHIQERATKQLALLLSDYRHPSLQTEKMKGHRKVFEGRVTQGYRFVFQIVDDTYLLLSIGTHDILKRF